MPDQLLGEGTLAGARRAGEADAPRAPTAHAAVDVREYLLVPVALVLDQTDRAGQRDGVAAREAIQDLRSPHGL